MDPLRAAPSPSLDSLPASRLPASSFLPDAVRILRAGQGSDALKWVHELVHTFRAAHDFETDPERYARACKAYEGRANSVACAEAIIEISQPSYYAELRQRGRMRSAFPKLDQEVLEKLCHEIKAALVWRAEIEGG